jgi:hypothetical protein
LRTAVEFADLGEDGLLPLEHGLLLLDERVYAVGHVALVLVDRLLGFGVALPEGSGDEQDDAGQEHDGADDDGGHDDRAEEVRVRRRGGGGGEEDRGDCGGCA